MTSGASSDAIKPVVIVGAGLAGWTLAREVRSRDPARAVAIICADSGDFYSKPMLSNALALGKSPAQLIQTEASIQARKIGVELRAHAQVDSIDLARQVIQTSVGEIQFGELVLATGADPIRLPIEGVEHAFSVNDWQDYAAFRDRLDSISAARVAIIGGGLIGSEFANDLAASGHSVQVIDPGEWPVSQLLDAANGHALAGALRGLGVAWHWGDVVTSIRRLDTGAGYALALRSGQAIEADVVLSAVGLRPRTALAQAAGLQVQRGIVVNAWGQTSHEHVWALGDCAAYESAANADGSPRTLPFVLPIMAASKAIASSLTGSPTQIVFGPMKVRVKTPAFPVSVDAI